jgi:NADH:ubiquinone oxidoreductase subunit 5 (subunit L)/multisubunit Na+/H+ antiporter MnhA subunit
VLSDYSSWLVWLLPLISCLFVPVVARIGGKAKEYYSVLVSLITMVLALSIVPDVIGSSVPLGSSFSWISSSGINAGVFIDPLSVLFSVLISFFGLIISI